MARLHAVATNSIPVVPMGLTSTLKDERGGRRERGYSNTKESSDEV